MTSSENHVDFSKLRGMIAPLTVPYQKHLEAVFRESTAETWDAVYTVIVDSFSTLWQYVAYLYPGAAEQGFNDTPKWVSVPTTLQVRRALQLAYVNVRLNQQLVCNVIKRRGR